MPFRTKVLHDGFFRVLKVFTPYGMREVVRATNSASLLLHDKTRNIVLLITQPHAALACEGNPQGHIIEAIAGRFDCDLSPKALIVKEALEEAGVTITEDDVEFLNNGEPMALSAGITNEVSYLAYAEITSEMVEQSERIFGVRKEGEHIIRIWMSVDDFLNHTCQCVKLFAYQQWLKNKLQKEGG